MPKRSTKNDRRAAKRPSLKGDGKKKQDSTRKKNGAERAATLNANLAAIMTRPARARQPGAGTWQAARCVGYRTLYRGVATAKGSTASAFTLEGLAVRCGARCRRVRLKKTLQHGVVDLFRNLALHQDLARRLGRRHRRLCLPRLGPLLASSLRTHHQHREPTQRGVPSAPRSAQAAFRVATAHLARLGLGQARVAQHAFFLCTPGEGGTTGLALSRQSASPARAGEPPAIVAPTFLLLQVVLVRLEPQGRLDAPFLVVEDDVLHFLVIVQV